MNAIQGHRLRVSYRYDGLAPTRLEGAQFHVILAITYLIAAAGFTHIIAGGMEAFSVVLNGRRAFSS
jgi:formate/nitrite transporter FocA (FNT family)